jgi:hypothetical protein
MGLVNDRADRFVCSYSSPKYRGRVVGPLKLLRFLASFPNFRFFGKRVLELSAGHNSAVNPNQILSRLV